MEEILSFLNLIKDNNNREWFNEHKDLYLKAKDAFEDIAGQVLLGVQKFDSSCKALTLKDCLYRFYRDLRFTKDKSPYKTHFGVYICPKGKKSMWAGYYFHIEPKGQHYLGGSMIACGSYNPDASMLNSVRMDLVAQGDKYMNGIKQAKDFFLCSEPTLKSLPKGFPSSKYDDLVKLKAYLLEKDLDEQYLYNKDLVHNIVKDMHSCYKFVSLLNESFSFSGNY